MTWKTLMLATLFSIAVAGMWGCGTARAAIDTYMQFGDPPPPPPPAKTKNKSTSPGSRPTNGVSRTGPAAGSGGGGHRK
jgi:hypothetical protein